MARENRDMGSTHWVRRSVPPNGSSIELVSVVRCVSSISSTWSYPGPCRSISWSVGLASSVHVALNSVCCVSFVMVGAEMKKHCVRSDEKIMCEGMRTCVMCDGYWVTCDGWCLMCNVGWGMCDVWWVMCNVWWMMVMWNVDADDGSWERFERTDHQSFRWHCMTWH